MKLAVSGAVVALTIGCASAPATWAHTPPAEATSSAASPAAPIPLAEPTIAQLAAQLAPAIGKRNNTHADDLAAIKAYYDANPETPLWVQADALSQRARDAIAEIGKADDWGLKAASFSLPSTSASDRDALATAEAQLTLAVLQYARQARGGRLDASQLTEAIDRTPNLLAPDQVLTGIAAAPSTDAFLRKLHPQHPQFERLRQLYLSLRDGKLEPTPVAQPAAEATEPTPKRGKAKKKAAAPAPAPLTAERVLFNMEQWRWMPDDLGRLHVKVNIPEFQLRMIKDGQDIYTERVVTGTVTNQTPIFSKQMQTVVFQPGWGVPPSIKVKELLPGLLAGRDPVGGRGYRMSYRGREVSASSIDWRRVDIRQVSIVQPPGPSNALGMVKFLFPNKHDVYMHDTPSKGLFNADVRAFSHGCIRVRNPMRFAEMIFAETGGWGPQRVASLARGKPENQISVPGEINVHITYFTVVVGDDGKVRTFRDIYGHEPRVQGGLEGRIAQVARKSTNLSAVRTSLISRAGPSRTTSWFGDEDDRPRDRRARRGGGFFSLFDN